MSECCEDIEEWRAERVEVCGVEMSVKTANRLYHKAQNSDAPLHDLLNDELMLNQSVTLSLHEDR